MTEAEEGGEVVLVDGAPDRPPPLLPPFEGAGGGIGGLRILGGALGIDRGQPPADEVFSRELASSSNRTWNAEVGDIAYGQQQADADDSGQHPTDLPAEHP